MLDRITPVLLSYNEAPNIGRTLTKLKWARDIVIVDSFSADETLEIAKQFAQVRIFQRAFDSHAAQWNFAVHDTGVSTEWVLALDADYTLTDSVIEELEKLNPSTTFDGYRAQFIYCVWGKRLRSGLYPPVTVLFKKERGQFFQEGHTHRLAVSGAVSQLAGQILHDDRKNLSRWLAAQDRYMRLEVEHILGKNWSELGLADLLRRLPPIAPIAVFLHCYIVRGGIFDGKPGLYYALQRALAEALLALRLLDRRNGCSSSD